MTYEYESGTCNINRYQQKRRYLLGFTGLALAGTLALFSYSFNLDPLMSISVFAALFAGFEGLFQGRFQFCAGFAARGIRSKGESDETEDVPEDKLAEDREMARLIHFYSVSSAIFLTAIFYMVTYSSI